MTKTSPEFIADPDLEQGPTENRSCTDILCCLLFIASWFAVVGVASYGITQGNPNLLIHPIDSSSMTLLSLFINVY